MQSNQLKRLLEKDSDKSKRRIGVEIERIGVWPTKTTLQYSDNKQGFGVETIIRELSKQYGSPTIDEMRDNPLGVNTYLGKVSLEPGGQLELSTNPVSDLHALQSIVEIFQRDLDSITKRQGLEWLSMGVNPYDSVDQIELIPSPRYQIMTDYFKEKDKLGTSMMRLTASVQINLDYCNEKDAIEMLRMTLALAPLSYALFSNSPFSEGKRTDFLSYRSHIWRNTDKGRTGLLPEVFSPNFTLEDYATLVWNKPLMYVQNKEGEYLPAEGKSLRDIEEGKVQNVTVHENNQMSALRQMFTEARLKTGYVEIRSLDSLNYTEMMAATAFFTGIMYSEIGRTIVEDKLCSLSPEIRDALWIQASREGVRTCSSGVNLRELSKALVQAARNGLKSRELKEEEMLYPLEEIIKNGETPAERWLKSNLK